MKQQANSQTIVEQIKQKPIVLKLKGKPSKKVTWTEDTVDNEHMGKKKSNICCIFNPPEEDRIDTCSSDTNNELERSEETKREHLQKCSKRHTCHHNQFKLF